MNRISEAPELLVLIEGSFDYERAYDSEGEQLYKIEDVQEAFELAFQSALTNEHSLEESIRNITCAFLKAAHCAKAGEEDKVYPKSMTTLDDVVKTLGYKEEDLKLMLQLRSDMIMRQNAIQNKHLRTPYCGLGRSK